MKLGNLATVGVVLVGVAGMLTYAHFDQAGKLAKGQFKQVDLTVVHTQHESNKASTGLVFVRWQDPDDGSAKDSAALIASAEVTSGKYQPGQTVKGWVHPALFRPELSDAKPTYVADQGFMAKGAVACAALGLALIAWTLKMGWFVVE